MFSIFHAHIVIDSHVRKFTKKTYLELNKALFDIQQVASNTCAANHPLSYLALAVPWEAAALLA